MRRFRASGGAVWESKVGYSRAVRVGPHVYVTGTTSFVAGGEPVTGDAAAQAQQIFANLQLALERLGASLDDVVRTRIFVTDIQNDWQAIGKAHADAVGHVRPATTMVEVAALIEPWMKLEIEVDAFVGASEPRDVSARIRRGTLEEMRPIVRAAGLQPASPSEVLIGELDGDACACVGWTRQQGGTLLESLAVVPDARSQGVATLLVDTAMHRIGGETWLLTENAQTFFQRMGFATAPRPSWLVGPEHCADATAMVHPGV